MIGPAQFGIVIGALGGVLMLMGLFPTVTGITPGEGIGIVQFVAMVLGAGLLNVGAILYVKFTLYPNQEANLTQQICVRVAFTGLVLAAFTGMGDYLGFGSHVVELGSPEVFFGSLQAGALLVFLLLAALGVLLYAMAGSPPGGSEIP
ncbi:MAG: hypothetical protein L6Q98_10175 [Anaerolineae bacterium]|nr:hypothetical protein [Anaerolineae bacterium]NUQ03167.1 hypothetical protein [Anaerolineae bacterium]